MNDDDLYGDDEFGLDDLDDLDDLDFDLDDLDDEQIGAPAASHDSYSGGYQKVEQTFLQKYFYAVVAFVAISLLGLWFLGQSVTQRSANAPSQNAQVQTQDNEDEEQLLSSESELPMPVPLNSFAEDELPVYQSRERVLPAPEQENAQSAEQMYDPGILTPLPGGVGTGYDALERELQMAGEELEGAEVNIGEIETVPPMEEENEESDGFDAMFDQNPGLTLSVKKSDLDDKKESPSVLDTVQNLLDDDQTKTKKAAPTSNKTDLNTIKSELSDVNKVLSQRITQTDTKVDDLMTAIKSLEAKIDALDQQTSNTSASTKRARSTPTTTTVKAPAATTKRKTTISNSSTWELRSAQTGKAVVARKGTSDFRTVEVGMNLSGVGKIKSIMLENGRWVVRGSSGKITQK